MTRYFSAYLLRRAVAIVVVFATTFASFVGCKNNDENKEDQTALEQSQENPENAFPKFSTEIRSLTDEQLSKLGPVNDLPTDCAYPGAYFIQVAYPEKIAAFDGGADVLEFFSQNGMQIPVEGVLEQSNLALISKGFTFESLKDAKSDVVLQEGYPTPVDVVYLRSDKPFDKEKIKEEVFRNADQSKIKTSVFGKCEARYFENQLLSPLDQTGQNVAKIDHICAGVAFPTENTLVFISGAIKAFELYFSDLPGDKRGIAAQRIARAPLNATSVAYQYDVDFDFPNAQLVQFPVPLSPELADAAKTNLLAFQILFAGSDDEDAAATVKIDCKTADGANDLRKILGAAIMQSVDNLNSTIKQNASAAQNSTIPELVNLLKSVSLAANDAQVIGSVKNTPESRAFFVNALKSLNEIRKNSHVMAKYRGAAQALQQFGVAFTRYASEHGNFPADIRSKDGEPLLSWRVALLPVFGEEYKKLYDQFKLDEPWNSENNLKLLAQIPPLYVSSNEQGSETKTQFLIFNSPETPFGKAKEGLKLQSVDNPYKTISVFYAQPNLAVEWTQPESVAFNTEKPSETFGDIACAVTLMGEIVSIPCDDSKETAKNLAAMIFGIAPETTEGNESTENANASDSTQTNQDQSPSEPVQNDVDAEPQQVDDAPQASDDQNGVPSEPSAE